MSDPTLLELDNAVEKEWKKVFFWGHYHFDYKSCPGEYIKHAFLDQKWWLK